MTLQIKRPYYPPAAKVDAANAASREKWLKERVPDTHIRIEFMAWAWEGRLLGEVGDKHVKSIDGGWLNELCQLCLPDGTVIEGSTVDLPNDRICANAAILREERESGVFYGQMAEVAAKIDATHRHVEALAEVVPEMQNYLLAAVDDALAFNLEMGKQLQLSPKEQVVLEAVRAAGGQTPKASRELVKKYGKGKGYSQGNVWKIVAAVNERIKAKKGLGVFDTQKPTRYAKPPDGTLRR